MRSLRRTWTRTEIWVVLGLLALALLLRLVGLTSESLWYDEAYSVWSSSMDIASPRLLWEWQIEFPLYYWLLHFWMRLFGEGEFSVRAYGALAGVLAVLPMYLLGRSLGEKYGAGPRVGTLGALLLAVNPYHIWYSQEVRMYAWAVLTTLISLYAFWRLLHGAGWAWWLTHAVVTGMTFHLHYYVGWMVLAQDLVYLLWLALSGRGILTKAGWHALRRWLLDQTVVLVLALPAFAVFWTKAVSLNQWGWLAERYGPPGLAEVIDLVLTYVLGTTFLAAGLVRWMILLILAMLLAWGAWWAADRVRYDRAAWLPYGLVALTCVVPLTAVFILGQFAAVWVPRYLLFFLPSFLLLIALAVSAMRQRGLAIAMVAILLALSAYALGEMYGQPQKEQWREVASHVKSRVGPQDLVVLMDAECRVPFSYYYGSGGTRVEIERAADGDEAKLARGIAEIERKQRGGNLWLVVSHAQSIHLEGRLDALAGLTRRETLEFIGIRLVRYVWS